MLLGVEYAFCDFDLQDSQVSRSNHCNIHSNTNHWSIFLRHVLHHANIWFKPPRRLARAYPDGRWRVTMASYIAIGLDTQLKAFVPLALGLSMSFWHC